LKPNPLGAELPHCGDSASSGAGPVRGMLRGARGAWSFCWRELQSRDAHRHRTLAVPLRSWSTGGTSVDG